jgi:polysaccharide deacetylase family protein (PEP-CTERM system associated)
LPSFLLTIDVEDWFQVENLRPWIPFSTWDSRELRVEANVNRLLDLFDSFKLPKFQAEDVRAPCSVHPEPSPLKDNPVNPAGKFSGSAPRSNPTNSTNPKSPTNRSLRATFFVLGWIAKRLPHLVRKIATRGHEVASHGTSHRMCNQLSEADLRNELAGSKHLLEDITGTEVSGFRAPNFSVSDRVISILQESGYRYDSSYNNFSLHGRYGKISLNGQPKAGVAFKLADGFFELQISNLSLLSFLALGNLATRNFSHFYLPWSGGAYFRLMPVSIFTRGVRAIIQNTGAYVFYMHPWEVDPGQPRFKQASLNSKLKHYTNLGTTHAKLCRLVGEFADCSFQSCKEYLELQIGSRSAVTDRMDG